MWYNKMRISRVGWVIAEMRAPVMLIFGGTMMQKLKICALAEKLPEVNAFLDPLLEQLHCPGRARCQIDLAVEEIFVNIAHYAYGEGTGSAVIAVEALPELPGVRIIFEDTGMPYDPLAKEDPDVTLAVHERKIGGLGIFLVKKTMTRMEYRYENGKNILTLEKSFA